MTSLARLRIGTALSSHFAPLLGPKCFLMRANALIPLGVVGRLLEICRHELTVEHNLED